MKKPLFAEYLEAEEYQYLYTDNDNMNYYSAKIDDNEYVVVDDYDSTRYTWDERIWSEENIIVLANNRLLCKQDGKYGVVDYEGWTIIPFVYEEFIERKDKCDEKRYNVRLNNRWGVINLSGQDVYKIKYKQSIPIIKSNFHIFVEDADTNCKGVLGFDGTEIIPTIYSQIKDIYLQNDNKASTLYFLVAYGSNEDFEGLKNGIWGCYNWQGEEIIPVKFHSIHCIENFFIVGDDEYIGKDYYSDEDYFIGTYDLYDKDGNMIIGGFNHIQIKENYFILQFGIEVKQYWERIYFGKHPLDYDEELNYKIIDENSISIIIDDNLKSLVPLHLITDSEEEIKYEYDVLMNTVSEGQGILIGEYPNLKRGKRYSSNDNIIKKISVRYARFDANNIIIYSPYKEVRSKKEYSDDILRGLIFCREHMMTAPLYLSMKAINDQFVFIKNDMGLVGIRDVEKELIEPYFDLITNFHKECAVAFKIICRHECDDEFEDDYETQTCTRECEYTILRIVNNTIVQEKGGVITDTELYDLLYSSDLSLGYIFNDDDLTDKEEYWKNIPRNENNERFWFPLYSDFKYLSDNYDGNIDKLINEWDDNWDYYNDNLDMDQQSPEFWNF